MNRRVESVREFLEQAGVQYRHVCVEEQAISASFLTELTDNERACTARAIARRQAEFATGRALAKKAMRTAGWIASELLPKTDRSPAWPEHCFGSISHSGEYCAAAVMPRSSERTIGIDLERARTLEPRVVDHIASANELMRMESELVRSGIDKELAPIFVFSAKEALYKAQHPITQTFLGFFDVELVEHAQAGLAFSLRRDAGRLAQNTLIEFSWALLRSPHGEFALCASTISVAS